MELRQLRYFLAVAEDQSFSKAALRLHISQPPLSTQIKALEDELGVVLLTRGPRGASLTAAGQVYFEAVRDVLKRLGQAHRLASATGSGEIGQLSVGFVSIADYGLLPRALKAFRSRHPQIDVHLHELTTDAQIRELRESRIDLGIGLGPISEPDIEFVELEQECLLLAGCADHPLMQGRKRPIALERLSGESFIVPPRELAPALFDQIVGLCRRAGFEPRVTQQARQMQTVISLVACGMGWALVPESMRNLHRDGVDYRRLQGESSAVGIGILTMRGTAEAAAKNFAAALTTSAATTARARIVRTKRPPLVRGS